MSKTNVVETIDYIISFLSRTNDLNSEMEIYGDNLSKLVNVRAMLVNNIDPKFSNLIEVDIMNIQNFIAGERIITSVAEITAGEHEELVIDDKTGYNQRVNSIELVRLGVVYFLMLTVDLNKALETKKAILILAINAMRNRSYDKLKPLMQTLLHKDLVGRLDQYITENEGDKKNKARFIYLKLSQFINQNEIRFETEEELKQFVDQFIISDVNTRIGEPIGKGLH